MVLIMFMSRILVALVCSVTPSLFDEKAMIKVESPYGDTMTVMAFLLQFYARLPSVGDLKY